MLERTDRRNGCTGEPLISTPIDPPIEIETGPSPSASVIWLHGLGADGNDFVPIVPELPLPTALHIRFIFPHAPVRPVTCNGGYAMRAWYDIYSLDKFDHEDEAGLIASQQTLNALIDTEIQRGIPAQRIVLMGFSQGGAVALFTGLRHPQRLAGIGALSTYLPLHQTPVDKYSTQRPPIFMAHGRQDPVVKFHYGQDSSDLLEKMGYEVRWKEYAMEHAVCAEEINDIAAWLNECLPTESS
jgi:phospholipase/carboxylesterase